MGSCWMSLFDFALTSLYCPPPLPSYYHFENISFYGFPRELILGKKFRILCYLASPLKYISSDEILLAFNCFKDYYLLFFFFQVKLFLFKTHVAFEFFQCLKNTHSTSITTAPSFENIWLMGSIENKFEKSGLNVSSCLNIKRHKKNQSLQCFYPTQKGFVESVMRLPLKITYFPMFS